MGVGFIVGEFGPFGEDGLPQNVMEGYLSLMMQGMHEEGGRLGKRILCRKGSAGIQ